MHGVVLAAGEGRRLRPLTDALPKTLLPVDGDTTILDIALRNLSHVGLSDVALVTGFATSSIESRRRDLERRHGVSLSFIFNDKATVWNNAYSLWLARDALAGGALILNGDTVHPWTVEETMLDARGPEILLALDDVKRLGEEEMKVVLGSDGRMVRINKAIDPTAAHGEYIGVTLVEPLAAAALADSLEAVWRRDPGLYYEDGFQEYADRGGEIRAAPIGTVEWVEVDDHADLARAREVACLY